MQSGHPRSCSCRRTPQGPRLHHRSPEPAVHSGRRQHQRGLLQPHRRRGGLQAQHVFGRFPPDKDPRAARLRRPPG